MAASLAKSFPRSIPSNQCRRAFASSPHPFTDVLMPGVKQATELTNLMDDVVENTNPSGFGEETAQGEAERKPKVLAFGEHGLVRPIDYNRDMARRHTFRGRPFLGPGREARYDDIFLQLGIDPRREADNETLMCAYMTRLGRIQPRSVTGLSQRSQRLVGKAIKRAKMMGVVPILSNSKSKELGLGLQQLQDSEEQVPDVEEAVGNREKGEEESTKEDSTEKDSKSTIAD